jgi:hypothetical protein
MTEIDAEERAWTNYIQARIVENWLSGIAQVRVTDKLRTDLRVASAIVMNCESRLEVARRES